MGKPYDAENSKFENWTLIPENRTKTCKTWNKTGKNKEFFMETDSTVFNLSIHECNDPENTSENSILVDYDKSEKESESRVRQPGKDIKLPNKHVKIRKRKSKTSNSGPNVNATKNDKVFCDKSKDIEHCNILPHIISKRTLVNNTDPTGLHNLENLGKKNHRSYTRYLKNRKKKQSDCTYEHKNTHLRHDTRHQQNNREVKNPQKIVNLSNITLSDSQCSLLQKGLKFCPTQKSNDPAESRVDLDNFHSKLRTKQFFDKDKLNKHKPKCPEPNTVNRALDKISPYGNITSFLKLKGKSYWRPPYGSSNLETFININEMDLLKEKTNKVTHHNITKSERDALVTLSKNKEIIIKQADKGGAIVIQNTTDYIMEANRQLGDDTTYVKTKSDTTKQYNDEVNTQIEALVKNGEITEKLAKILKNDKPRTPQIYFLPKIHKGKLPPPGRPIVSANGCATEKISAFVDHFLNPLVKKMESYVEDTSDFLRKIDKIENLPENCIRGTLDVTSLYTNIPNKDGIESIKGILNKNRNKHEKPSTEAIVDLLTSVLNKNNFQFNGTNYIQIGGTAMGTKVAPSFANLFMSSLEEKLLESYPQKPKLWLRYIDDIFYIWEYGEDDLNKWLKHLNTGHDNIKFTNKWSKNEISFLDTKVKIDNHGKLYTDLYTKPTDTNSYLDYTSAHPPNCKNSLPYSQLLRLKRICTNETDFIKNANKKIEDFKDKNYPELQWPQSTIVLFSSPICSLLRTHLFFSPHPVSFSPHPFVLFSAPSFLFSAPICSLLRTHLFSSPHPFVLFSAPFLLFSAPFLLFSLPVIVVTLLPIMQSYSVNSLWILECNNRLRVAFHVFRMQTSAWRMTLQFHGLCGFTYLRK